MKIKVLSGLCLALLQLHTASAAEAPLLGCDELTVKIQQVKEYQLLDARSAGAQRNAPIAFATKYRKVMPVKKGLVLIVADTDSAALEIVTSIPETSGRNVFAVRGGTKTWQCVQAQAAPASAMPDSFVIPMNTCEQGKPLQELKRNKPLQEPGKK